MHIQQNDFCQKRDIIENRLQKTIIIKRSIKEREENRAIPFNIDLLGLKSSLKTKIKT